MHPAAVRNLHRHLTALGVDASSVFDEAGLGPVEAWQSQRAPRDAHVRAKGIAARRLDDPALGYALGLLADLRDFDLYGGAVTQSDSMVAAMETAGTYHRVWEEGASCEMSLEGPDAVLVYRSVSIGDPLADLVEYQHSLVFLARMVTSLRAAGARGLRVSVAEPSVPADRLRAATWLADAEWITGARDWSLAFPAADLSDALDGAHPAVRALVHATLEQELAQLGEQRVDVVEAVATRIRSSLARAPAAAETARALGVSLRTLQERLQARGTTYRRLVDEARQARAQELLADPAMTVEAVAEAVGFRSVSSFSRFFRGRTGQPPAAWRRAVVPSHADDVRKPRT